MSPLNAVLIEHPNNPNNVITLPKQKKPKRLLVFVGRKEYDTFDDEPGSPMGKGFFVEKFSRVHWDFLRTQKVEWFLNNAHKYKDIDAHKWLEGHYAYTQRIHNFMLEQLNLDPNKYHIMSWSTEAFKPIPTLHEIQP